MKTRGLLIVIFALCFIGVEAQAQKKENVEKEKKSFSISKKSSKEKTENKTEEKVDAKSGKSLQNRSNEEENARKEGNVKQNKVKKGKAEKAEKAEKVEKAESAAVDFKALADSLAVELKLQNDIVKEKDKLLVQMQDKMIADSIKMMEASIDEISKLKGMLAEKDRELSVYRENQEYFDMTIVRLANRWLIEKYDPEAVSNAIKFFDRIYSKEIMKEEREKIKTLLSKYDESYREFHSILRDAQNDEDRESIFLYEQYRNKYIKKIKEMSYYRTFHGQSWKIIYLSNQINQALDMLENHTDQNFVDFTSLIDYDFLQ